MRSKATFYVSRHALPRGIKMRETFEEAVWMLDDERSFHTYQMCLLSDPRISSYDIVIREGDDVVRLTNNGHGWDCDRTDRELRYENNLYRLWRAGEFDRRDLEPWEIDKCVAFGGRP